MDDELLLRALTGRATRKEQDEVNAWTSAAPENARRFRELHGHYGDLVAWYRAVDVPQPPSSAALIRQANLRRAAATIRRVGGGRLNGTATVRWAVLLAAGGALVVAGYAAALLVRHHTMPARQLAGVDFISGESGISPVVLNDGTTIRLGARSRLRVDPRTDVRQVSLEGRAEFSVAHDATRPFHVLTAAGDVQDLGTRFAVRVDGNEMQVAVFEGRVAVAGLDDRSIVHLGAGDVGAVSGGQPQLVRRADSRTPTDWVQAGLVFEGTRMDEVAKRLSTRYHIHVSVIDTALTGRTVTAWFMETPSARQALTAICRAVAAECRITDSAAVLASRKP